MISIIPEPVKLIQNRGFFKLNANTIIYCDLFNKDLGQYLRDLLAPATGFNLSVKEFTRKKIENNSITLKLISKSEETSREEYKLIVSSDGIEINSINPEGLFYGIQTLRQIFPPEIESSQRSNIEWIIPCVTVEDSPRFSWRGFMLDEARHFFGKEVVKEILDIMAFLKLNIFHWHLTDYQGWRIEIKNFPRLTDIGSKRKSTTLNLSRNKSDGKLYSGYYSQEDLREIVNYAKERFIKIVPEIDMPGHITAALAAYPNLGCIEQSYEVSIRVGIFPEVLCIGKESTFKFIEFLLQEIIEIFPSNLIHIGGDEVLTKRWKNCELCQKRMKNENLRSEEGLQIYFANRISKILEKKSKKVIVWNDILNDLLSKQILSQFWMDNSTQVIEQVKKGRNIIMSEMESVYLNHGYRRTPLSKSYLYEPIPDGLNEKYHKNVLGIEACLWTELILEINDLEKKILPRLAAIAETGWTSRKKKNFVSFQSRLPPFLKRLQYLNINYAKEDDWF
ncbi:MAG: beta-N-acetylhexosaminidase [Candidatus Hodarchaeota archaeon]